VTDSFVEVEIEDTGVLIIKDNIESEEYKEALIREYRLNLQSVDALSFQFYTDGSLGNSSDGEKRMGAAWVQTEGPNQGNFFAAGVTDWPSSYRAEIVAIILAMLTVPQNSEIEIVTDSASCINTFHRLYKPSPKHTIRRWIKEKNWSLWMRLFEIIRRKRLQVKFKKVKAHSGDKYNDQADRLAKEGKNFPEIIWKDPRRPLWSILPVWNNLVIDMSLREFIKEVHIKETVVDWCQQNRVQKRWSEEINKQDQYSWKIFWSQCRQGSSIQTSMKQAKERNFRIKMMNDELPTLSNLKKRLPDVYRTSTCIQCGVGEEDTGHLFSCPALVSDRAQIWEEVEKKTITKFKEIVNKSNDGKTNARNPVNLIHLIKQWKSSTRNPERELINKSLGLFSSQERCIWKEKAKEDGIQGSLGSTILENLSHNLLKLFRKRIWIPRCERTIAWERTQGISSRQKRKKDKRPLKKSPKRRKQDSLEIPEVAGESRGKIRKSGEGLSLDQKEKPSKKSISKLAENPAEKEEGSRERRNLSLGEKVIETVWDWIKEGKKWVGY